MKQQKSLQQIAVLGDGGWGTTLAIHLAKKGYSVKLWGAFPTYAKQVSATRENKKFLPEITIPQSVAITGDLSFALSGASVIVLAIPSQYTRSIVQRLRNFDLSGKALLSVTKGIEISTLKRISQIIHEELGAVNLAVLSGPTIAREVALGIPTTAVIASKNMVIAKKLQKIFNSNSFRIYTNTDVVGTELGGSVKNVIAIACGICDGLGFGSNAKAAILTRGLAEMARLGIALGAQAKTFSGLTGLGDLATTCFSPESRNRRVGEKLGEGKTIKQILASTNMIAEGISNAKAVFLLSKKNKIDMPITSQVYSIIYQKKNVRKAVTDLMQRTLKSE
ncbi:MAG: NAD(P)H-dependent glycerol-3-phosphate dehydrogenase [Candidatus Omnitrophota bacterium]